MIFLHLSVGMCRFPSSRIFCYFIFPCIRKQLSICRLRFSFPSRTFHEHWNLCNLLSEPSIFYKSLRPQKIYPFSGKYSAYAWFQIQIQTSLTWLGPLKALRDKLHYIGFPCCIDLIKRGHYPAKKEYILSSVFFLTAILSQKLVQCILQEIRSQVLWKDTWICRLSFPKCVD